METLGSLSRLYVLALLLDRGPLSFDQIEAATPVINGVPYQIEIGRGATIVDFVKVMLKEDVLTVVGERTVDITGLGRKLVADLTTGGVNAAVAATPAP
jgi:hypothetical protein